MNRLAWLILALAGLVTGRASTSAAAARPNILVIVADDMGFSDPGCYGGDVRTPNLDALARNGLRFTQFYNCARCGPSRTSILTGYFPQQVRRDAIPGLPGGGKGTRPPWARLLPEMLKPLGYRSYHSGKWHIDGEPMQSGLEHSYQLEDFNHKFAPQIVFEDGKRLPPTKPDTGYYTATAFADHAIKYLKEHAAKHAGQPFFEYLAFTEPHFPLQAPPEDIARYRHKYEKGWEAVRDERWRRMTNLGIINCPLSALEPEVGPPHERKEDIEKVGENEIDRPVPWTSLTVAQREFQAAKMAIHAAMVDRMDQEIGRVLAQIRAMGAWENTVIFFLSDNGASAELMIRGDGHNPQAALGSAESFLCLGPGFSSASNTPFRRHKTWVHEGGIATPLIVHWPQGITARGELRHNTGHVVDLVPTILEIAGGHPDLIWANEPVPPPPGKSLIPVFARDGTVAHDYFWWYHEGNRAVRVGDWKLVAARNDPWELYDLSKDRAESGNLARLQPERARELEQIWTRHLEEFKTLAAISATPGEDPRAMRRKKRQAATEAALSPVTPP